MAERSHWWTERCLRSPFFRSLSLTIYLPTYLFSMYLSIYRSIYLSLSFIQLPNLSIYLFPKVVRAWCVLYILTWKCASRHNGVHFFDIWTSKSGRSMVCFVHFDLEMCFAPQRRALFQHLNFQKWSGTEVFCTFWLRNVLRATTACTFSTSQLPKVVRRWGVLCILTWKCASRHNGVHFFDISTSKSGPSMVCFVHFDLEMCFAPQRRAIFSSLIWPAGSAPAALASLLFDPPEPQIIGKTQCFKTFLPFRASASSFFWFFLFWSSLF